MVRGSPRIDTQPYTALTPHLTLPPFLDERVVYHHSFEHDTAEANPAGLVQFKPVPRIDNGLHGSAARLGEKQELTLSGSALSPHTPITISFWWAVEDPLEPNAGIGFFALTSRGRGFISNFVRGGPWCALTDSAYCFQVYHLPGIKNINSVFDRQFRQRFAQGPNAWHHTVLTVSLGNRLALFVDGRRVALHLLAGRSLRVTDGFERLSFGQHNRRALRIDELTVLDLALSDEQVTRFHGMVRSLQETGHLGPVSFGHGHGHGHGKGRGKK